MTINTKLATAAAAALASVMLGTAANAAVEYSFLNSSVAFSDFFSSPVTTSATVAPTVDYGTVKGDVTYTATTKADYVSFNGHNYSFAPTAFSTMGTYTSGSNMFGDLLIKNTPAAPEASDYAFMIAGLAAVGGYMAYRQRRGSGKLALTVN